jgi:isopenicillin N synthase-like dioxygenase
MIVNVGDTLTRWTNGKITSDIHQVTTPEAMKGESGLILPPRMSMAYLFKAERNVSIGPLPKFVSSTEPAKYPDKIASVQDVLETALAKTHGGVTDLVNAGNAIQPVQPLLA